MCVYLRTKFQVSTIILTNFRVRTKMWRNNFKPDIQGNFQRDLRKHLMKIGM